MFNIKYDELEFTHFVVDNSDGTVFGSARINGSGQIANFLINGEIKEQKGDYWQELATGDADIVRERARNFHGRVPVYRIKRLLF